MKPLALILLFPRRAATLLFRSPRWFASFTVLALLAMGSMLLAHSGQVERTLVHLPPGLSDSDRAAVASDLDARLPARVLFLPVRLLLGWSTFALVLFVTCRTVFPAGPVRYLHVLALEVHCESAGILGTLIAALWPHALSAHPLLNSLNISILWYVAVLIGGVGVLCDARPLKAALVVLLVWGSSLAFHTAVHRLLRDALHLAL